MIEGTFSLFISCLILSLLLRFSSNLEWRNRTLFSLAEVAAQLSYQQENFQTWRGEALSTCLKQTYHAHFPESTAENLRLVPLPPRHSLLTFDFLYPKSLSFQDALAPRNRRGRFKKKGHGTQLVPERLCWIQPQLKGSSLVH